MKTVVVHSLGELVDSTTPEQPDPASGRRRAGAVYRAVSDADGKLLTSLDRLGGLQPPHSKIHLEEHLLRNFIRHGSPFLPADHRSLWEVMITAEHHGLPTRLLDWSQSPMVAAHFATLEDRSSRDRVVWHLDWKLVHDRFGLRNIAFLVDDLDEVLEARGFKTGWDFLQQNGRGEDFICLLDPPAIHPRLAVQSGVFTLSTCKGQALDDQLSKTGLANALTRFVIPGERAEYVRDQLDLCTVDERRLFPGLDGVAAELRRYYAAGNPS